MITTLTVTAFSVSPSFFACENITAIKNTCCSPTPGGLVLQTQIWSTWTGLEKKGQKLPKGSWTIHGLWPDNCDGSFEQYCDFSRQYDPTPSPKVLPNGTVAPQFGRQDPVLTCMENYWINQGASNVDFWDHEICMFSKHATCTSTFNVACYDQYPTFDMLAAAGITPSNKTSTTLTKLQNAIKSQTGAVPYFGCSTNGTVLSEVWYFNGTEQFGITRHWTPSSCSKDVPVWYYERTKASEREVRHWRSA
ncbi:hypothetical protein K443DRAFT_129190 [Laccaria amethystina LaAM-08-1]|uniref:Uncharacterized protein n=1 Tax=Laccaria amethystina LaAM-08-1 TaxID=1095629 RepID=A0A0C9XRC4_9AGAR|nr:hypothetical protein K443DRAFT_129190 [Laccaria amethystina LaAM-08-1]